MQGKAASGELTKQALRLAAVVFVYVIAHSVGLHEFTAREVEGLNTLILLVGSIYAVILAFAIFVIWGQFNDVENSILRECTSLNDIRRFSAYLPADAAHTIGRNISDYVQQVIRFEWTALGEGREDKRADQLFNELVDAVVAATPENSRLIDMARRAGEHREERVARSLTRMPPTLLYFVNTIAAVLALFVFAYPFHHALTGVICFVLVAFVLSLADLVMKDMDNPLQGLWNVSSHPFSELKQ